jgi:hypothetical protein
VNPDHKRMFMVLNYQSFQCSFLLLRLHHYGQMTWAHKDYAARLSQEKGGCNQCLFWEFLFVAKVARPSIQRCRKSRDHPSKI